MEQQTEGIEVRIAHNGEDYEARTLDVLEGCVELVGFSEDSAELALVHLKDGVAQVWGCEPEIGEVFYVGDYRKEGVEGFPTGIEEDDHEGEVE